MTDRESRAFVALLVVATLLIPPPSARACGPFLPEPLFTPAFHPQPLEEYTAGKLGLIQPTFARAYLVVAYRYLSNHPLSPAEQAAYLGRQESIELGSSGAPATPETNWGEEWLKRRKTVAGDEQDTWGGSLRFFGFGVFRWTVRGQAGIGHYNCLSDAFRNAVETLDRYEKQFGRESAETREWAGAQDRVFAQCPDPLPGGEKQPETIPYPAELAAEKPARLRADRAYQIAAAHFYAADFDEAQRRFEQIAADPESRWRALASYLVARCWIRRGTLLPGYRQYDENALLQAEKQLRRVVGDPGAAEFHAAAQGLLNYVDSRLHPREHLRELSRKLLESNATTLRQNLEDYTFLLDRFVVADSHEQEQLTKERVTLLARTEEIRRGDDLTDWILTFQFAGPEAFQHARERWQQTRGVPWLFAVLEHSGGGQQDLPTLLAVAKEVPPSSPAFVSISFHRFRLLAESGQEDAARQEISTFLAQHSQVLPRASLNMFLALRMKLARTLEEFLADAPRIPAGVMYAESERTAGPWTSNFAKEHGIGGGLLDLDSVGVLNRRLPLHLLAIAARSRTLPSRTRREIAIAVWARYVLLEDHSGALEILPVLESLVPEAGGDLEAYRSAPTEEARKFAAAFAMLRFPGFQVHISAGIGRETPLGRRSVFRDNWWCTMPDWRTQVVMPEWSALRVINPAGTAESLPFLSKAEQKSAEAEWKRLSQIPPAPNWLGATALDWAKRHPEDPRVPEALHLVVRATRYGCGDAATGKYSKEAFQLLHRRYPKSEWAKKTPFWFN